MKNIFVILLLLVASISEAQQVKRYEDKYVSVTPVVTASSAYTAKDSVGGLMTFSNITCQNMQKGQFVGVIITDKADNAVEYNIIPFKSSPSGTFTDKTTMDPTDADLLLAMPFVNLQSTDRVSFSDNGYSSLSSLNSISMSANASIELPGTLYLALQTLGTPTYGSTGDITVTVIFRCN